MTSYDLEYVAPDEAGIAVVALAGELDLTNADELIPRVHEVADGVRRLVLDLNRLVFIDGAAIHHLFEIAEKRDGRSTAFVVDPSAAVAGTLGIVGLGRAAPVVASLAEAKTLLGRV